ncbi:L,D-transpeptidase family protein [Frankia sp. Mgl5]|uniref:L,D-transpeptidase family protein n=1 Tax=Frankia sp. Mgl5 TaxID=2933793 RepID=UPI00200FF3D1|nr:L,D-transpeptidase family protein [Frankia sp. Mgl5]MCK9928055.1 L,D-transpeptidase family protein [Frankia sp. Mgl5]
MLVGVPAGPGLGGHALAAAWATSGAAAPAPPSTGPPALPGPPAPPAPPEPPEPVLAAGTDLPGLLGPGDQGAPVLALQRRLVELGYWLGEPNGIYGALTVQAVLAAQKVAGLERDGLVGPATWASLRQGPRPLAVTGSGLVLEVDVARQLLLVVQDGSVRQILNTSTGTERWYEVRGQRLLADTPRGTWHVYRQVDGVDPGPLGGLYRPKYFHTDGIAVHGYVSVPGRAASHGCVRVTNEAMDWLWASGIGAIGTTVLVR